MNISQNQIGIIALLAAVFFAGAYLRGERMRKKEIKAEIERIQQQQEQILNEVKTINQEAAKRDKMLLEQIDTTYAYLDKMNEVLGKRRTNIREINKRMEEIKQSMAENKKAMNAAASNAFQFNKTPTPATNTQ